MVVLVGPRPASHALFDIAGILSFVLHSSILLGAVLFMTRRWRLPFGAISLMFSVNSLLMVWMRIDHTEEFLFAISAAAAGLLADYMLSGSKHIDTSRLRLASALVPFVYCLGGMLIVHLLGTTVWAEFWPLVGDSHVARRARACWRLRLWLEPAFAAARCARSPVALTGK